MSQLDELDETLEKKAIPSQPYYLAEWSQVTADYTADLAQGVLGFVPNGLGLIYDCFFKRLPLLKSFFAHAWVEEFLKIALGITIGKGLSKDLARYLFWPVGYVFGLGFGLLLGKWKPTFTDKISTFLFQVSGQTMAGVLTASFALLLGAALEPGLKVAELELWVWGIAISSGALIGLMAKTIMLVAVEAVTRANAASSRLNAKRAKKLGSVLKESLKKHAKTHVNQHARSIIEQMHGPQQECHLTAFLTQYEDQVSETIVKKIERHINFLSDRAINGDVGSLKRLVMLYRDQLQSNGALEEMLKRLLNHREVLLLKDTVDTVFDRWFYRDLLKA